MPYSLTINFTPPTGNGYQYVTEYRVKYWPTSSPTNISTVFTTAFPLVLTDLNLTSYSGTIEAKCGVSYGSPRSFGPVVVASSGGGGGTPTTPACPYRVVLYEDESVSYPIGASGNTTSCPKPGYRIKLTTEGGALVTTSTALTVNLTQTVETGDCASPIGSTSSNVSLTIPSGSSTSTSYIQASGSNDRISNISFASGNPATLVNGSLTCNLTYTGGGTALPTRSLYLNAFEINSGTSNATVRWTLTGEAMGMLLTGNNLLPFSIKIGYAITGSGVSGTNNNTSQEVIISGLDLPATESMAVQGTTGSNWSSLRNTTLRFSTTDPSTFNYQVNAIEVFNSSGGSVNNPVVHTHNGVIYRINVYRDYTLGY
jgi:hypothetical protein